MTDALLIHQPLGTPQQLFLLFHGVGGLPQDLRGLGAQLAQAFPQAAIVAVPGAFAGDMGRGRQWFSVQGIDEANRPARVAEALPFFLAEVRRWQAATGVGAAATALVGFSQGAIMALEASKQAELLAARVVAMAGRYAVLPAQLHAHCTVHLIHGKHDEVMPYGLTVMAAKHLVAIGADVTADVLPFVRHEISPEVCDLVLERLQGHIPQARWREAMAAAQGQRLD